MTGEFDWLYDGPRTNKELARIVKESERFQQLDVAVDGLKGPAAPRKRLYILCYVRSLYDPRAAKVMYESIAKEPPKLSSWRKDSRFLDVLELAETAVYKTLGITPAAVLAMLRESLDKARREGDQQATARYLDMIGKHLKMWNNAEDQNTREGPALNINIIAPQRPEIDVTPDQHRVTVDVPIPED